MNKQVYLGLLALLNLAVLQAADGPDVQGEDKNANDNRLEFPVNPVTDHREILKDMNLKQFDVFSCKIMEYPFKEARKQDVPWVLAVYYRLEGGQLRRR